LLIIFLAVCEVSLMGPARNKSHYDFVRIVTIWQVVKLRMEKEWVGICRGS